MNRLKEKYSKEVVPKLVSKHNYETVMLVPKIDKIVINMGVGDALQNSKLLEAAMNDLEQIIGCKVTLRGEKMYNFLDKLINVVLPRVRDFRGLSPKSFDGRGNYTIGLKEQLIFPEIEFDNVVKVRGMDVVIVTTAQTNEEAYDLLDELGVPFRK